MKHFIYAIVFLSLCVLATHAQTCTNGQVPIWSSSLKWTCGTPTALPSGNALTMIVPNAGATGTTVNRLAKLTGAPSTAVITATTDTENGVGIVVSGAGTTGSATIAIIGQVSCDFDGATTAGNYVIISATTAGKCHDGGSAFPNAQAAYGRVLSTNGASGTYVMELMTPDIAFQNAGNGKSRPAGSNTQVQYNSSGVFGATNQFTFDTTTNQLQLGTDTPALSGNLHLARGSGSGGFLDLGWNGFAYALWPNGNDVLIGGGLVNIYSGGSNRWQFGTSGHFTPVGSNGGFNIGDSTHRVGTLSMYKTIDFGNVNDATASEPMITQARTWNNAGVTFQNIFSNITNTASAAASTLIDLQVGSATKFNVNVAGHITTEGVTATGATGMGKFVFDTSPTFTTSAISPLFRSTAAKVLVQGTGTGATQLAATQTTAPTCSTNCGTSPSVVGTDTAGIITMGATGSPASGFVLTFNGTWAAAPSCVVQMALAGMLVGKMPLTTVSTTGQFTVVTNGTAPANSDKYQYICIGTQ